MWSSAGVAAGRSAAADRGGSCVRSGPSPPTATKTLFADLRRPGCYRGPEERRSPAPSPSERITPTGVSPARQAEQRLLPRADQAETSQGQARLPRGEEIGGWAASDFAILKVDGLDPVADPEGVPACRGVAPPSEGWGATLAVAVVPAAVEVLQLRVQRSRPAEVARQELSVLAQAQLEMGPAQGAAFGSSDREVRAAEDACRPRGNSPGCPALPAFAKIGKTVRQGAIPRGNRHGMRPGPVERGVRGRHAGPRWRCSRGGGGRSRSKKR